MSGCGTFRRYRIQATVLLSREERPCFGWCHERRVSYWLRLLVRAHVTGAAELQRRLGLEGFVAYVRGRKQSTS